MENFNNYLAENKKEELTDYMKEAVALVKQYVPPEQGRIQAAKDAGKMRDEGKDYVAQDGDVMEFRFNV